MIFSKTKRETIICILLAFLTLPCLFLFSNVPASASPSGFSWPLRGRIVRGFEKPTGPYGEGGHQGIDIAAIKGTPVKSAGDGEVLWTGELPRGRFVSIAHSGGAKTTYLDLERVDVSKGKKVRRGQVIGTVYGTRDDSSPQSHLHFSASVNGVPIDPRLLMSGIDASDFIRLCPVERAVRNPVGGSEPSSGGPGFFTRIKNGFKTFVSKGLSPFKGVYDALRSGCSLCLRGLKAAGSGIWSGLCFVGRKAKTAVLWVWRNRWVQATVAAICAAVVAIGIVVVAVIFLPVSATFALIAAAVAALSSIGFSFYVAATHPGNSIFLSCFIAGLTAGASAGLFVVCVGVLSGAIAQGFLKLTLFGFMKEGLKSASFSLGFELLKCGITWSRPSWTSIAIAACIGFFSGGISRVVKEGMVTLMREGGIKFATRLAHIGLTGGIGVIVSVTACKLSGASVTWANCFAAFSTGALMGVLSLAFGGEGIRGFLSKFRFFREKLGRFGKEIVSRLASKILSRGMKTGVQEGAEKVVGTKEVIE
ncbi:MAG: M23 family metallopeptidase [Actinomycetota bacterium]|nr:M23 family metallopeptidase [Actinomycetota bacterium]